MDIYIHVTYYIVHLFLFCHTVESVLTDEVYNFTMLT